MAFREEIIGDCRLRLGDCLEVMPTLGQYNPVNLVVTDPPYELSAVGPGKSHYGMSLGKFDLDAYKALVGSFDIKHTMAHIEDICSPFNMFCFCSNKQISKIMGINERAGRSTTLLVWHKINAVPFANGVWRGDAEFCVHAKDKGAYFEGNAQQKTKVTPHPIVRDTFHPTVKPLALIEKYIKIGSSRGQTVLDPFMGSGTTGVACVKLGRKFIGIELEEKYFDLACRRIQKAYDQPDLFIEEQKKAEQTQMDLA